MLTRCWKFGRRQKIDSEFLQVKEEGVVRVWISLDLNCNYVITIADWKPITLFDRMGQCIPSESLPPE